MRVDRGHVLVGDDAGAKGLARRQMPGDVAAVVHIGPLERAVGDHRRQHLVGDGTSYGRHRRDENFAVRPDGGGHAAGDRAFDRQACIADRLAQQGQLLDQLGQDGAEPIRRLSIGAPAGGGIAERLGYDVDRAVVQVQPLAVREQGRPAPRPSCVLLQGLGRQDRPRVGLVLGAPLEPGARPAPRQAA